LLYLKEIANRLNTGWLFYLNEYLTDLRGGALPLSQRTLFITGKISGIHLETV
jgi:hypothetical protein